MDPAARSALKYANDTTADLLDPVSASRSTTWGKLAPFQGLPLTPLLRRDATCHVRTVRLVPVILSGGAGTRLWPLSRETAPKPSMPLPDGETLLAKTAARALALPGVAELVTVTNRDYYFHTKDAYAGSARPASGARLVPARAVRAQHGAGRRARGAVDRAAQRRRRGAAGAAGRSPDPRPRGIRGGGRARGAARARRRARHVRHRSHASRDRIRLHRMRRGGSPGEGPPAFAAVRFVEKPPPEKAREYVAAGNYVWNSGMFCFTAAAILAAFARHAPDVLDAVRAIAQALAGKGDLSMLEIDAALFAAVPDISLDYAVMEKAAAAGDVAVVRGTFDWSDVGSWQAMAELSRGRRPRQPRPGRARHDRDHRNLRPRRRSRGRDRRRREPRHRRHAGRRARRAPRSPAARQGRRRRAEGARPRILPAAQDGRAALGRLHGAGGGARASRSSASR